ncbi:HNH endonuclease [bacterium JGI 053]|nr:HNH endonuclease [bacterium JGI 053]
MAIPTDKELVPALLELLLLNGGPKHELKSSATYDRLAERFGLSEQERIVTRPFKDGRYEPLWNNRVQWARNELRKSGFLDLEAGHGAWRLSSAGVVAAQARVKEALSAGVEQPSLSPALAGPERDVRPGSLTDVEELNISVREGGRRLITHFRRERVPAVVKAKKKQVLALTGKLCCEACDLDFREVYGERGAEFCEAHHTRPLSDTDREVETRLEDLALLCSNCHRMIHRRPYLSVEELRSLVFGRRMKGDGA